MFVRSGIRFDYLLCEKNSEFLSELVRYHISGQLKVAPEHCSAQVLDYMGKPHFEVYLGSRFLQGVGARQERFLHMPCFFCCWQGPCCGRSGRCRK